MQHRSDASRERYQFDSLAELQRFIADTPRKWRQNSSQEGGHSHSWDLGADYATANRLAKDGWIEGAQKTQRSLKALTQQTPKPAERNGFYGYRPHVPRYCAGAPDHMIQKNKSADENTGAVLNLVIPVNATANVGAEQMANFGLAVAHWCHQLERDNTRLEIWGAMCSMVSGKRFTASWLIKRANQPLDLAVLAFAVGHPAMFRRLGFAMRERSAIREQYGYGNTVDLQLADLINPAPNAFILNGMSQANRIARTPADAVDYVEKQIDHMRKDKQARTGGLAA